jgi:hypothetical protein
MVQVNEGVPSVEFGRQKFATTPKSRVIAGTNQEVTESANVLGHGPVKYVRSSRRDVRNF